MALGNLLLKMLETNAADVRSKDHNLRFSCTGKIRRQGLVFWKSRQSARHFAIRAHIV